MTIPLEYDFYAVDQPGGPDEAPLRKLIEANDPRAPVQIHTWISKTSAAGQPVVADWVVAERLLVRRGEYIGTQAQRDIFVPVLVWNKFIAAFEPAEAFHPVKKKPVNGAPIKLTDNFMTKGQSPPFLVDFDGGFRVYKNGHVKEETAVDLLIIDPDGKLIARNTRVDAENTDRISRLEAYRKRFE